jgi:hypothetical protein
VLFPAFFAESHGTTERDAVMVTSSSSIAGLVAGTSGGAKGELSWGWWTVGRR